MNGKGILKLVPLRQVLIVVLQRWEEGNEVGEWAEE